MLFLLVVAVKEGVVNGLTVFKQDNPQRPILKVRNTRPAPDPPIGLNLLLLRVADDLLNPLVPDSCAILSAPCVLEVFGLKETSHR